MLSGLCFAKPFNMVSNSDGSTKYLLFARVRFPSLGPFRKRTIPLLGEKVGKLGHIRSVMWEGMLIFHRLSSHCEKIHCRRYWLATAFVAIQLKNYDNLYNNGLISGGSVFLSRSSSWAEPVVFYERIYYKSWTWNKDAGPFNDSGLYFLRCKIKALVCLIQIFHY